MRDERLKIVFSGGGTAGHLFPGLALAEQLAARPVEARITFAGSGKDFERRHVAAAGFDYLALPCQPLPKRLGTALRFFLDNLNGYRAARRFLRRTKPSVVVGLGGYASVPMCRAAAALRVPLVLLEQNAVPGRATRWLAPWAALVCTAFDDVHARLRAGGPVRITGNPIRAKMSQLFAERANPPASARRLVVLGGSGGAQTLNEQVPRAFYKMREQLSGWQIVHQSGVRDLAATQILYGKFSVPATVTPFIENLSETLLDTSLVICRAGGTTLAELAAAGMPAILVPYPHATDDHQRLNALAFAQTGAACVVEQDEADGRLDDRLVSAITTLIDHPAERLAMSQAMRLHARPDAAWHVASIICDVARSAQQRQVA